MGQCDEGSATAQLAALAVQLRDAAIEAGRGDVAQIADQAIAVLTQTEHGRGDTASVILRTLDGLGF